MSSRPLLLVTGGSGYIGSLLVKKALATDYQVHVLDAAPLPLEPAIEAALQNGRVKLFTGSIADSSVVRDSLHGVQSVIHLAGVSDGRAGKADPEMTRKLNADATRLLLDEAKASGIRRFIFASTMGVYGNQYRIPLTEDLSLVPIDPYSESKAIGEQLAKDAASDSFCTIALRIAMVYGAGVRIREDFLVNKMCQLAVQQGALVIAGGEQRRPQIHIHDLVALFLELLQRNDGDICGEAFNAVASNPSLDELAGAICNALPNTKLEKLPMREGEDSFKMSGRKLEESMGFKPRFDLRAGIEQTIEYFQKQIGHIS